MKNLPVAAAISGLMLGLSSVAHAESRTADSIFGQQADVQQLDGHADKHACKGQNTCKGQGGCKTDGADKSGKKDKNACSGTNGCS